MSSSEIEPSEYDVQTLLRKIEALEKKGFCFENFNDSAVKNYTGIDKAIFQVILLMPILLKSFFPSINGLGSKSSPFLLRISF